MVVAGEENEEFLELTIDNNVVYKSTLSGDVALLEIDEVLLVENPFKTVELLLSDGSV